MWISGLLKISLTRSVEWTQPAPCPPNMTSHSAGGARCIVAMSSGRLFFAQYDAGLIGEIIS
jgi:hypothetical protein